MPLGRQVEEFMIEFRELFFFFLFPFIFSVERYPVSVPMFCWVEQNDKNRLVLAHMKECFCGPSDGIVPGKHSVHGGLCLE